MLLLFGIASVASLTPGSGEEVSSGDPFGLLPSPPPVGSGEFGSGDTQPISPPNSPGPPQPLPPQDPNITGQQRQQQNLNLREFFLQYMAGIHKCVDRYTYTERWTQTDRKIDRQIER